MNNTLRFLVLALLLTCTLASYAQIRSDYRDGMNIPDSINLSNIAPKDFKKITIERPFPEGFYTIVAQLDNYREQTCFLRLMTFEIKQIMSQLWGKSTLAQKKTLMKNILISYGCKPNKYGTFKFYGSRWNDVNNDEVDDGQYLYPHKFDKIITKEDTQDNFFGKQFVEGEDFAYLLPDTLGVTHIELLDYYNNNMGQGILIQLKNKNKNNYYYKNITEKDAEEIEFILKGNYPKIVKTFYFSRKLKDYDINSVDVLYTQWELYKREYINGKESIALVPGARPITRPKSPETTTTNPNNYRAQRRSMLLEFLRSQILSEKEQEWYNKHYTKEQLDAMTSVGLGLGLGDGVYRCKSCGSTFSNQADLRAHENAYHDY